jgi:uncharacterized protein (DUF849 family)
MARSNNKVIITCAVTGSIHTPTMSPHLPVTPDEIAADAVAAAEAGASILHLHARDPETGQPSGDPDLFMRFLPRIKQQTNSVVNITTGGGQGMTLDQRIAAAKRASPEMASLNMGSINFGLYPMLDRYQTFNHDWERAHLEGSRDAIFRNTFADIERVLQELGEGCGTRFEFECYDVGHLYNLAHFLDRGLVKPPLFVQSVFGILGGIGPAGRSWRRAATRCRCAPWRRRWGPMCGSGWRTACTWPRANWRPRTPRRWPRSAASWRTCRWRSPPRTRPAKCWP